MLAKSQQYLYPTAGAALKIGKICCIYSSCREPTEQKASLSVLLLPQELVSATVLGEQFPGEEQNREQRE